MTDIPYMTNIPALQFPDQATGKLVHEIFMQVAFIEYNQRMAILYGSLMLSLWQKRQLIALPGR